MAGLSGKRADIGHDGDRAEHHVRDPSRTPWLGRILAYGALVPLLVAAVSVWFSSEAGGEALREAALIWSACLLAFFAGVRRGVSFRTEGGPTGEQLGVMAALFTVAVVGLLVPWTLTGLVLAMLALAALGVVDARAAMTGEAPRYFAGLRPPQMGLAVLALALLTLSGFAQS